jgi:hypothetical protein|nr:MAG TPA: hypothetical protein [Caudoviricetes sp.]
MASWFETVVPNDRTWVDLNPVKSKLDSIENDAIVKFLNEVLGYPTNPKFQNDSFTAIVNINNGFIPGINSYSGYSVEFEGTINGDPVRTTTTGADSNSNQDLYAWEIRQLRFVVTTGELGPGKDTMIDAGTDYIVRVVGSETEPVGQPGSFWVSNGQFNSKLTTEALNSIKAALGRAKRTEN